MLLSLRRGPIGHRSYTGKDETNAGLVISAQKIRQHANGERDSKRRSSDSHRSIAFVFRAAVYRTFVLFGVTECSNGVVEARRRALAIDALPEPSVPHVEAMRINGTTIAARNCRLLLDAVVGSIGRADGLALGRLCAVALESLLGILIARRRCCGTNKEVNEESK